MAVEHVADAPPEIDIERMRGRVAALTALDRRATRPEERRSAELVAAWLRDAGAVDVTVEPFRSTSTWAGVQIAHDALALGGAVVGGPAGAALALGSLSAFELDYSGRLFTTRRLLARGTAHNVSGRIPSAGPKRRTLIVEAHHDAANGGIIWHPHFLASGRRRAMRTRKIPSFAGLIELAMLMVATTLKPMRLAGGFLLALAAGLAVQAGHSETTPGASDNASGVAGLLELTRFFAANPLPGTEIVLLSPSSEEPGAEGIAAWLRAHRGELEPETTLLVGLDTLGSGTPLVVDREGATGRYHPQDLAWADRGAARVGMEAPQRFGLGAISDPMVARHRGLPAISILSERGGALARIHTADDTLENVDWESVASCVRLAAGIAVAWSEQDA